MHVHSALRHWRVLSLIHFLLHNLKAFLIISGTHHTQQITLILRFAQPSFSFYLYFCTISVLKFQQLFYKYLKIKIKIHQ